MTIDIRSEQPGDEPALERLVTRAFGRSSVAELVTVARTTWPTYDRALSLVAVRGERLVGHVLLLPARLRLDGVTRPALSAGPVGVAPDDQRQGIGGRLLERAREVGRATGAALIFLAGHPSYYPRHGFQPCYGFARGEVELARLPRPAMELTAEPVRPADLPWLAEAQERELADVDFGWLWPETLAAWKLAGVNATIWWTASGRRAGYCLSALGDVPENVWLLADDADLAREVLARVRPRTLAHHPAGWLAREVLDPAWATVACEPSPAAMACPLVPGVLDGYLAACAAGTRQPGSVNWPLPFRVG